MPSTGGHQALRSDIKADIVIPAIVIAIVIAIALDIVVLGAFITVMARDDLLTLAVATFIAVSHVIGTRRGDRAQLRPPTATSSD